jgi:hypothetical protein
LLNFFEVYFAFIFSTGWNLSALGGKPAEREKKDQRFIKKMKRFSPEPPPL